MIVPILQGPLRGRRWIVGSSNHGCWLGSFEFDKQRQFTEAVCLGSTVFDVGAHVGFYTLLAAVKTGPTGGVLAFEPCPRNVRFLNRHVVLNNLANVTVVEAAVTESPGTVRFSEGPSSSMGQVSSSGQLEVRATSLDHAVLNDGVPAPDLIKFDIEGEELRALRGAREVLSRWQPTVFLATHGDSIREDCCELLREAGYSLASVDERPLPETDEIVASPRAKPS